MSSLYQISEKLKELETLMEAAGGDVSEGSEGANLEKWIETYEWQQREKVDAYCEHIRNIEGDILAINAEVKRLSDRSKSLSNKVDRMKDMLKVAMEFKQVRKLDGVKFGVAIQKNGGKPPIEITEEDPAKLPIHLVKIIRQPDKDAIREALENGDPEAAKVARIGTPGESVRIR